MSVTLQEIADRLEISTATVSRSLRNDRIINPETRARVNEAARRMGYKARVRRPARSIENQAKTMALGLLLRSDSLVAVQNDTNLMKMMAGVMAVTDAHRVVLQLHTLQRDETRHMDEDPDLVPPMVQEGVCRAMIAHGDQDERDLAFLAKRVPVVTMGRVYRNLTMDAAVGDNVEGVRVLVKHLVDLGHRRLAWVGAPFYATFFEARQAGFIQGCLGLGLQINPKHVFGPDNLAGHGIQSKPILAAAKAGVTGFVCGNDAIALRVIEFLEAAGHRVPEDASVTGFDAWQGPRPFTTIDPHFYEIGEAAAQLALQRITKPASQPYIVSVRGELVTGDTTGPVPR